MIVECIDWDKRGGYCFKHSELIEQLICPKCLIDNRDKIFITIETFDEITEGGSKIIVISGETK